MALDHPATRRRISLPARKHGLGIRSRVDLAPVAFIAGFTEAAERFLDRDLGGGITSPGFFTMLEPLFGAGAFDQRGHRLSRFLDGPSPTSAMYDDQWYHISQAYGHHMGAPVLPLMDPWRQRVASLAPTAARNSSIASLCSWRTLPIIPSTITSAPCYIVRSATRGCSSMRPASSGPPRGLR